MSLSLRRPGVKAAVGVAILLLALGGWSLFGRSPAEMSSPPNPDRAWYTIDDGKTWFADAADKITPFEKDGKQACRVYLHSFDGGKTTVATKLERFTDKAAKALTSIRAAILKSHEPVIEDREAEWHTPACVEIKRPGETLWKSAASEAAVKSCNPVDPKNPSAVAMPIYPPK